MLNPELKIVNDSEVPARRRITGRVSPFLENVRKIEEGQAWEITLPDDEEERKKQINTVSNTVRREGALTWKPAVNFNKETGKLYIRRPKGSDYKVLENNHIARDEKGRAMTIEQWEKANANN